MKTLIIGLFSLGILLIFMPYVEFFVSHFINVMFGILVLVISLSVFLREQIKVFLFGKPSTLQFDFYACGVLYALFVYSLICCFLSMTQFPTTILFPLMTVLTVILIIRWGQNAKNTKLIWQQGDLPEEKIQKILEKNKIIISVTNDNNELTAALVLKNSVQSAAEINLIKLEKDESLTIAIRQYIEPKRYKHCFDHIDATLGKLVANKINPISESQLINHAPIREISQDKLEHAAVAEKVCAVLTDGNQLDTIFALVGSWGSGKSGIINMTETKLLGRSWPEKILTLQMSCWDYRDIDIFIEALFHKISEIIMDYCTAQLKLKTAVEKYIRSLTSLSYHGLTINLGKLLYSEQSPKVLIENVLEHSFNRQLVIFLDDLDRLRPKEALDILRIIYAITPLPNVKFLLAYDEGVLLNVIDRDSDNFGNSYLNKLIHKKINIPILTNKNKWTLFEKLFMEVSGQQKKEFKKEAEFEQLIEEIKTKKCEYILFELLQTPRDYIKVIIETLNSYRSLPQKNMMVYNLFDLFIFKVINYKTPSVYSNLTHSKEKIIQCMYGDIFSLIRQENEDYIPSIMTENESKKQEDKCRENLLDFIFGKSNKQFDLNSSSKILFKKIVQSFWNKNHIAIDDSKYKRSNSPLHFIAYLLDYENSDSLKILYTIESIDDYKKKNESKSAIEIYEKNKESFFTHNELWLLLCNEIETCEALDLVAHISSSLKKHTGITHDEIIDLWNVIQPKIEIFIEILSTKGVEKSSLYNTFINNSEIYYFIGLPLQECQHFFDEKLNKICANISFFDLHVLEMTYAIKVANFSAEIRDKIQKKVLQEPNTFNIILQIVLPNFASIRINQLSTVILNELDKKPNRNFIYNLYLQVKDKLK